MWQQLCNRHETIAFISFDMDRLKQINDTYGHQAGDYAIRLTGDAIRRAAPREAILARVGGDEFLAVLPRADSLETERFVNDFRDELRKLNEQEGRAFGVDASSGAVTLRLDSLSTVEECIQKSDEEMYRQKEKRHMIRGD